MESTITTRLNVEVNGIVVAVKSGSTVLQACEAAGIEIPRFCYHERLLVAGNCRMCLVEIAGSPKPQASCALPVSPNMKIFTDSPRVKKARESVMEFLLLNHPLDCPICDQAGECDRQDQSMAFGSDRSRMFEAKRGVEDKDIGPLVKTVMTRCIHCTRCIRFASEVAGVADRGTSGRGRETEVGTYVSKVRKTELSGNLIDLCPVGALTSKPYAFVARPWELETVDTIDAMDGFGASIRIQSRGQDVRRIQPREDDDLNQAWLGDKSRFSRDGARSQRITGAYASKLAVSSSQTSSAAKSLAPVLMNQALDHAADRLNQSDRVQRVVSPSMDLESLQSVKYRQDALSSKEVIVSTRGRNASHAVDDVSSVDSQSLVGVGLRDISNADICVLVGFNPRHEAPLLNLLLRDSFLRDRVEVVSMGQPLDLTYPVTHLGRTSTILHDRAEGNHDRSVRLAQAKRPLILVGPSVSNREDSPARTRRRRRLSTHRTQYGSVQLDWQVLNFYHSSASSTGAIALGRPAFNGWTGTSASSGAKQSNTRTALIRFGVGKGDLLDAGLTLPDISSYSGIISLSTHGDDRIASSDVVIPRPLFFETHAHYMNVEGRVQTSYPVVGSPFQLSDTFTHAMNTSLLSDENIRPAQLSQRVMNASTSPSTSVSTSQSETSNTGSFVRETNAWAPRVSLAHRIHARNCLQPRLGSASSAQKGYALSPWRSQSVSTGAVSALKSIPTRVASVNSRIQPSIHDYYLEGHTLARFSPTMAKASRDLNPHENFSS